MKLASVLFVRLMVSIAPPPSFVVLYALVYHTGPTLSIPQKEKNHMLWDFFPGEKTGEKYSHAQRHMVLRASELQRGVNRQNHMRTMFFGGTQEPAKMHAPDGDSRELQYVQPCEHNDIFAKRSMLPSGRRRYSFWQPVPQEEGLRQSP
jgi:hypothetical protein